MKQWLDLRVPLSALTLLACAALVMAANTAHSQSAGKGSAALVVTGHVTIDGASTPYLIRHLPVSSFPDLPAQIQSALNQRGCVIPQTYEAHHPENVVHASLERRGSSDWAVLCSAQGTVSLLVFFSSRTEPFVLGSIRETDRLTGQRDGTLGFDWGIDVATPAQVHDAQAGLPQRPAWIDHDALADEIVGKLTKYRFYEKRGWTQLDTPDS
jgi:hypothetical protein